MPRCSYPPTCLAKASLGYSAPHRPPPRLQSSTTCRCMAFTRQRVVLTCWQVTTTYHPVAASHRCCRCVLIFFCCVFCYYKSMLWLLCSDFLVGFCGIKSPCAFVVWYFCGGLCFQRLVLLFNWFNSNTFSAFFSLATVWLLLQWLANVCSRRVAPPRAP